MSGNHQGHSDDPLSGEGGNSCRRLGSLGSRSDGKDNASEAALGCVETIRGVAWQETHEENVDVNVRGNNLKQGIQCRTRAIMVDATIARRQNVDVLACVIMQERQA